MQKSNNHRGIKIQPLSELDLETAGTFVQQYIHKPLLVDGHKFDIGVYTIITSIEPLRAYIYDGDILFRFCPNQYHPFDANDVDKYVVGDDYLPIWEVPSLKRYYRDMGFGMKESFNAYLRSIGKDPRHLWLQVRHFHLIRQSARSTQNMATPSVVWSFKHAIRLGFLNKSALSAFVDFDFLRPKRNGKFHSLFHGADSSVLTCNYPRHDLSQYFLEIRSARGSEALSLSADIVVRNNEKSSKIGLL